MDKFEKSSTVDRYERMPPPRPTVGEYGIVARIGNTGNTQRRTTRSLKSGVKLWWLEF